MVVKDVLDAVHLVVMFVLLDVVMDVGTIVKIIVEIIAKAVVLLYVLVLVLMSVLAVVICRNRADALDAVHNVLEDVTDVEAVVPVVIQHVQVVGIPV